MMLRNSALFLISSMALFWMLPMLTLILWNGYDADLRVLSIHAERKKEKIGKGTLAIRTTKKFCLNSPGKISVDGKTTDKLKKYWKQQFAVVSSQLVQNCEASGTHVDASTSEKNEVTVGTPRR